MPTCFICNDKQNTIKLLFRHFKKKHWHFDRYMRYECREGQCIRAFENKFSCQRHLLTEHPDCVTGCDTDDENPEAAYTIVLQSPNDDANNTDEKYEKPPVEVKVQLKDMAARCLAKYKSGTGTLQQANSMAKSCSSLVEFIINDVISDVESLKNAGNPPAEQHLALNHLLHKLHAYTYPFSGLESEYCFQKYLTEKGYFIAPVKYSIGTSLESVLDRSSGFMKPLVKTSEGQYIPIKSMIQALHNSTDLILQALMASKKSGNEDILHSVYDGRFWKKKLLLPDDNVILLKLYGDDFEPGNPLGSHRTLYKVGAIYYYRVNCQTFSWHCVTIVMMSSCMVGTMF
jgi:hypothetical protein